MTSPFEWRVPVRPSAPPKAAKATKVKASVSLGASLQQAANKKLNASGKGKGTGWRGEAGSFHGLSAASDERVRMQRAERARMLEPKTMNFYSKAGTP